ncbi:hypothetical protein BU25DRAFT_450306 [Macroventuria anomochaeta]|uniref:Uncharacterized protein n=1 Tax=Macroventuria anomochaeta TaxID=301207 RepID=A0ACB6RVE1_9PLEO|nr:uncharacterized protein BU25DRAFT_450306 [Macroventuria anomochaeta]KAF2624862.1 hypothetical protein BU25DRAFT_450306 [Macroventuria anomochaeta]
MGTVAETTGDLPNIDTEYGYVVRCRRRRNPRPHTERVDRSPDDPRVEEGSPCFEVLRDLRKSESHIMFVTEEGDVGIIYHPDCANGIRPGDIVVGLFGINYPFILRLVPRAAKEKLMYTMINVAHVADHLWGYDFVQEAVEKVEKGEEPPRWSDFERFGSKGCTIMGKNFNTTVQRRDGMVMSNARTSMKLLIAYGRLPEHILLV